MTPSVALTVAASDPLGGAGLQADVTTFAALGVHGTSVVTSVTAQSLDSLFRAQALESDLVAQQLDGVIAALPPAACKTGLLTSGAVVEEVAVRVREGGLPAPVVDPVLVDGRGRRFVGASTELVYRQRLFPLARVLTPNVGEAAVLVGRSLDTVQEVIDAAPALRDLGAQMVVVTGGSFVDEAVDVVITADRIEGLAAPRIVTDNVRGSGCTFSAAIVAYLAVGMASYDAVVAAKAFTRRQIEMAASWELGGRGPISHLFKEL